MLLLRSTCCAYDSEAGVVGCCTAAEVGGSDACAGTSWFTEGRFNKIKTSLARSRLGRTTYQGWPFNPFKCHVARERLPMAADFVNRSYVE